VAESPPIREWNAFLAQCPAPLIVFERRTGRIVAAAPGADVALGPPGPARDARLVAALAAAEPDPDPSGVHLFEIGDDALCGALVHPPGKARAVGRGLLHAELAPLVAHELSQPIATVLNWAEGLRLRLGRLAANDPSLSALTPALDAILAQGRRAGELLQTWRQHLRDEPVARAAWPLGTVLERAARHLGVSRPELSVSWPDPESEPPAVEADPSLIEAALFGMLRAGADGTTRHVEVRGEAGAAEVLVVVGPAPGPTTPDDDPDILVARAAAARCGGALRRTSEASGPVFHLLLRGVSGQPSSIGDRRP